MKKYLKKLGLTFLITLYLEAVFHFTVFKTINFKEAFYIILFTITFSMFINLLSSFFKLKINKWIFIILNIFNVILFMSQIINYRLYGNIISIYSVFHGGQVFGFFSEILAVMKNNIITMILFLIPAILLLVFCKKIKGTTFKLKGILVKIVFIIISFGLGLLSLNIDKKELYSAKNLYYYKHVPNIMAQKFGILTTMELDLYRTITGFEEQAIIENNNNKKEEKSKEKVIEYNKLDINFEELSENETKENIKNIHTYMAGQTATEKNEYTGMFKGKNLIAFVAEAFSPIAVDPELTPTLYKLVNTGFKFNNFYTPVYYVSTSDGEYVSLTSLLPKESVWSFYRSSNNLLPYVYGNVFKNLGYTTYAFHDGTYKYYHRDQSHPNMGYTYIACGHGLDIACKKWPQSDVEMIDASFDYYADEEHFMTYYMTISGHLNYNFPGNNMATKNKAAVKDLEYSDAIKAYKATQIELDHALANLIAKLEEKGKLDDTVIVLSADHYPYGLTTDEMKEVMTIEDEKFDIHKNNLIIWSSSMEKPVEVNKIAESLDILPTVLNLFGVDFDSRLLIGSDILSNKDGLVIFNDRSWRTEKGTYNAPKKKFTPTTDEELPEDYVENINNIVYNKYVISKKILETNYYKYVFGE